MLNKLKNAGYGDVSKIECFDMDASKVDHSRITSRPHIVLIDGEHTKSATLSDFQFCRKVINEYGTVLFHDFGIIYPAVWKICNLLNKQHHPYEVFLLEGSVCAIFFDPSIVHTDPYLTSLKKRNKYFGFIVFRLYVEKWLNQHLPTPLFELVRKTWNMFRKKTTG